MGRKPNAVRAQWEAERHLTVAERTRCPASLHDMQEGTTAYRTVDCATGEGAGCAPNHRTKANVIGDCVKTGMERAGRVEFAEIESWCGQSSREVASAGRFRCRLK